jgi:hypothetical protein
MPINKQATNSLLIEHFSWHGQNCCDLDGYTLGMIEMASIGHLGWNTMLANPTLSSSNIAFTYIY